MSKGIPFSARRAPLPPLLPSATIQPDTILEVVISLHRGRPMAHILVPSQTVEDWKPLLRDPEKEWQPASAAPRFAACWSEAAGFPESVRHVLDHAGDPTNSWEPLLILPEHRVPLPGTSRLTQCDLWILAKGLNGLVSIATLRKGNEGMGPTLQHWALQGAAPRSKERRLAALCREVDLEEEALAPHLPYRLLHRTVAAVVEAKRFGAQDALVLVHSFTREHDDFMLYEEYLRAFGLEARANLIQGGSWRNGVRLRFAWVRADEEYLQAPPRRSGEHSVNIS